MFESHILHSYYYDLVLGVCFYQNGHDKAIWCHVSIQQNFSEERERMGQ